MIIIRDPTSDDESAWRRLWTDYLGFYRANVPDTVTMRTWQRILDPRSAMFARLAEVDGSVDAFAVCVLHDGTWTTEPICYLEDLFVAAHQRGAGVGRRLIDDLLARARDRGWSRLYWHTESDNAPARRLYDSYVPSDGFVRYRVFLDA